MKAERGYSKMVIIRKKRKYGESIFGGGSKEGNYGSGSGVSFVAADG